jgi:hypothetical protein
MVVAALVVDLVFVRMPKDKREGWDEADLAEGEKNFVPE